ncbi:MAG: periplasmic heavy metal sensor [Ignavibacteriales bacterium]|nr:periplasmic heavy metal sensor [Ignavibacteriales bacterium]
MNKRIVLLSLLSALFSAAGIAQPPSPPHDDPLAEHLFPPEMLMQHQKAIGLTEEQRTFVKTEMQKTQGRFMDLQWQLQSEMESMASLLKEDKAEEQRVLSQLEKILGLERDMKRAQLGLILRIKNQLSSEQQARLRKIREREREEKKR